MTPDELAQALADLGHARKAVQRPAAERLAAAARVDPAVRRTIAASLGSSDARRQWGAAYALALLDAAPLDAVPVLLDALGSSDGDLRWASARLLVRAVRHTAAIGERLIRLVGAASALQRKMALYCLRDLAGTVAIDGGAVVAALRDVDPGVRLAAMAAAVAILPRTADTAERVGTLLDDADVGVRRAAAATLGRIGVGTPALAARLERAVGAGDPALARAARQALSRLAGAPPTDR
jgi:hypothetical protein